MRNYGVITAIIDLLPHSLACMYARRNKSTVIFRKKNDVFFVILIKDDNFCLEIALLRNILFVLKCIMEN